MNPDKLFTGRRSLIPALFLGIVTFLSMDASSMAQTIIASDSTANYTSSSNGSTQVNYATLTSSLSTGFGSWTYVTKPTTYKTGYKNTNATAVAVNSTSDNGFYLLSYSNGGAASLAVSRSFSNLQVGDTLSFYMRYYKLYDTGDNAGFSLLDSSGTSLFTFAGQNDTTLGGGHTTFHAYVTDSTQTSATYVSSLSQNSNYMQYSFTLLSSTTYQLTLTYGSSSTVVTYNGTLTDGTTIDGIEFFANEGATSDGNAQLYVDNLQITSLVPEPGVSALMTMGGLLLLIRMGRNRNKRLEQKSANKFGIGIT